MFVYCGLYCGVYSSRFGILVFLFTCMRLLHIGNYDVLGVSGR